MRIESLKEESWSDFSHMLKAKLIIFRSFNYLIKITLCTHHPKAALRMQTSLVVTGRKGLISTWPKTFICGYGKMKKMKSKLLGLITNKLLFSDYPTSTSIKTAFNITTSPYFPRRRVVLGLYPKSSIFHSRVPYINLHLKKNSDD